MSHELRYPSVSEFAGLVKKEELVYVRHHLLTIDAENSPVSSTAFRHRLAGLVAGTAAAGQKNQGIQEGNKRNKTDGKTLHS